MATHYEILGVEPSASHHDVHRAYLRQARRHHPDTRPGDDQAETERARRRMTRVNAAWAVLGDAGRRQAYDRAMGLDDQERFRTETTRPGEWRPVEPDDDLDLLGDEEEEVGPGRPADLLVLIPVAVLALSVFVFASSLLIQSPTLMSLAMVLLPITGLAFVATPLLVMLTRTRTKAKS